MKISSLVLALASALAWPAMSQTVLKIGYATSKPRIRSEEHTSELQSH